MNDRVGQKKEKQNKKCLHTLGNQKSVHTVENFLKHVVNGDGDN